MKLDKIVTAMQAIESERMIPKEIVVSALIEALTKAYRKQIEIADALVRVDINEDNGDLKLFHQKLIVEAVEDDELEIAIEDALLLDVDYKIGDYFEKEIPFEELGRAAAILAKSVLKQKIREAEKQAVHDEYFSKLHEMVSGFIESVEEKFVVINLGKTLAILPKAAQIPGERYTEKQRIKVVITEVNKDSKGAQVLVSRADPNLVRRLFENEVPEIYDGIVEIKAIARDPGERCKISVYSKRPDVDAIGACIGQRGQRVKVISEEILGEKIDIFEWSENIFELIKNSFAPANVLGIYENIDVRGLVVVVEDSQLSLAIGKKGKNARLAVRLTGQKIDIKTQSEVEASNLDWKLESMAYAARIEALLNQKHRELDDAKERVAEEAALKLRLEEDAIKQEELAKIKAEEDLKNKADEAIEKKIKKAKKSLAERQNTYVSKLEALADSKTTVKVKEKIKKKDKKDETEERKLRASELKKDKDLDYAVKPVYSEEELKEISANEDNNQWENEVDYDELDQYYDYEEQL